MPGVSLRPVVKMLTSIENSRFPVALESIQVEHFRGGDSYNVQLGVIAYDAAQEEAEDEGEDEGGRRRRREGRAGPAAP